MSILSHTFPLILGFLGGRGDRIGVGPWISTHGLGNHSLLNGLYCANPNYLRKRLIPGARCGFTAKKTQKGKLIFSCMPFAKMTSAKKESVWLKLRSSLYEVQIRLGACLVSAKLPPHPVRLVSANPPPPPPCASLALNPPRAKPPPHAPH